MDASESVPETQTRSITRRTFIADLGRAGIVLASVAVTACLPAAGGGAVLNAQRTAAPVARAQKSTAPSSRAAAAAWSRADLGHVSAYIYARNGEATIIDTGDPGKAEEVGYALGAAGLDWSAVGHLILTHRHTDHVGSAADILARAPRATTYAGAEDIPAIDLLTPVTAVGDGDQVFGLDIITTPGHTPGSISVFDAANSVLVAGDALATEAGRPIMPSVRFLADEDVARASVIKLGEMTFETLLVGHGEPIEADASDMVAELVAAG